MKSRKKSVIKKSKLQEDIKDYIKKFQEDVKKVRRRIYKMSKIFHPVYDWWLEAKCACKLKKIFEHAQKPPIKYMHI